MNSSLPKVSIGVPVYNGGATLESMLDALLLQTFQDFEIIISDNASTDETGSICARYVAQDARVRYVRQTNNIGAGPNFKYVLEQARGRYFMWSASDDTRSPDFLEENVGFLEAHPDYVASTCPNRLEGRDLVTFSIEGDVSERFHAFFDHCWVSHGIFYAVIRSDVLRGCDVVGESFFGVDWAIDLYLASRGPIHRTRKGMMVSGVGGISNRKDAWRVYRANFISWILPFYHLSIYAMKLLHSLSFVRRLSLVRRLLILNARAAYSQIHSECYPVYFSYIKPWLPAADKRKSLN